MIVDFGEDTNLDTYTTVFKGLVGYTLGIELLKMQPAPDGSTDIKDALYKFDARLVDVEYAEDACCSVFKMRLIKNHEEEPRQDAPVFRIDIDNIERLHIY